MDTVNPVLLAPNIKWLWKYKMKRIQLYFELERIGIWLYQVSHLSATQQLMFTQDSPRKKNNRGSLCWKRMETLVEDPRLSSMQNIHSISLPERSQRPRSAVKSGGPGGHFILELSVVCQSGHFIRNTSTHEQSCIYLVKSSQVSFYCHLSI